MPRYFVHVNENPSHDYVRIHSESNGPCGAVFQNVAMGGPHEDQFYLEILTNRTIKTAKTDNAYWLIIWAQSGNDVREKLNAIENGLGERAEECNACCH